MNFSPAAGIGATLMLPNAQGHKEPVIGSATFGAVIIMVIITTLITPPVLKWSLVRQQLTDEAQPSNAIQDAGEERIERTTR